MPKNMKGFQPGQSGNPAGKPKGTRNHATRMVLSLMEGNVEAITQAVIDAARQGDLAAAKLVIERIAPPVRERPLDIHLPATDSAEGIREAQSAIVQAVACGDLLPAEGTTLSTIVEAKRKAMETLELEQRITALEAKK